MISEEMKSRLFEVVSCVILISIIFITGHTVLTSYLDYNSEKAQVVGTVTSSEVHTVPNHTSYDTEIRYEYSYNGQTYTSNSIKPGSGFTNDDAELVSNYPEGDSITVYVNEENPSQSWLVDELPLEKILPCTVMNLIGLFSLYRNSLQDLLSHE